MHTHSIHRFHRIRSVAPVYFILGLLLAVFLSACAPGDGTEFVSETEERAFQRGKQLLREGRRPDALNAFLSVIEKRRGDAPESHLEAGELFRTHIQDPVSAIYHYRKFLELSPNSPQASNVRQLIDTATKDFARTLPAQPMHVQYERLDLLETIEKLQRENVTLKGDLAAARQQVARIQQTSAAAPAVAAPLAATGTTATAPQRPQAAASFRSYTVESGDTLTRISIKMYGTGTRWTDIFNANRDVLPNENSLKIGMQLRIPE